MKRIARTGLVVVTGLALTSVPAAAQVCIGYPTLGPANIAVGAGFFDGGKSYSGGGTFGGPTWISGSFGYTDFDDTTLSLKSVGVSVGHSMASAGSSLSVCPVASAQYGFGLEEQGVDLTQWNLSGGLALGFASEISPSLSVIPVATGRFVYAKTSLDAGPLGEASGSDTFGILSGGLSFLFSERLTIMPSVSVPVGIEGDPTFALEMGIAVGR